MATKKLKVLTPQTVDGKNLQYDAEKKPIYTESIVELGSKKDFESLNSKLPEHLKHKFEEVDVEDAVVIGTASQTLAAVPSALETAALDIVKASLDETKASLDEKQKEIDDLKKQLEEANKAKVVAPAAADKK